MRDPNDSGDEPAEDTASPDSDAEPTEAEAEVEATADEPPPRVRSKAGKKRVGARGARAAREAAVVSSTSPRIAIVGLIALGLGAAGGWFGHVAQANAKLKADSAPAASGSAAAEGPCGAWKEKVCADSGAESAACAQAQGAVDLLTPSACEAALAALPATLAKVKAARVPCDSLVAKLCADLTPGSPACQLVKTRTPSFPGERCQEMLGKYDQVLAELKMLEQQQGGMGMPQPPGGMPMPPAGPPPSPHP